jgi:integrase
MPRPAHIHVITPTFYLDTQADPAGERRVMLSITYANNRVRMATGVKVHPNHWNQNKHSVRSTHDSANELNMVLSNILSTSRRIYTAASASGIMLTPKALKERIQDELAGRTDKGIMDYYLRFNTERESTKALSTIKSHQSTMSRLKQFTESKRQNLDFPDLTEQFFTEFVNYLIQQEHLTNNTIAGHLKNIRTFLRWCEDEQGITVPKAYRKNSAKVQWEDVEHVALSLEELERLEQLDLSSNKRLANIRDMFLLGCFTGLRYSDLSRLDASSVSEGAFIIRTEKTKEPLRVPITEPAQQILDRNPDVDFRRISSQKFNAYIKEVCLRAGIETMVTITHYSGSRKIEDTKPKYEFVSSHTMRRTFVTCSKTLGIDDHTIMEVTGHKNMTNFKKYLKLTNSMVDEQLKQAWRKK